MRSINLIVVHCSATVEGKSFTVADIDRWHRARGFSKIGYHFVIYLDGTIHVGRLESEIGAHVSGYNSHSIGVCYIGGLDSKGKPKDTRTKEQKSALLSLLKDLRKRYPSAKILGHRNLANKACPCFDAKKEFALL